ncbi:hypothetical protein QBC46DRAFT_154966 [Diplogelasinospora grovesii]|uniref:F-box domain-containing protein n=1 Tax=Diplogelasinospora grovesii TaxID=303347 RepID=A0AAN6S3D5_9PEZI|nr:hypothetical protein QBC46DRAFT_154966 [Diplogelasinospora grovesii]
MAAFMAIGSLDSWLSRARQDETSVILLIITESECARHLDGQAKQQQSTRRKRKRRKIHTRIRKQLPIEIGAQIIKLNSEDVECLRSCALVCRLWVPLARKHVFSSLRLDYSDRSWSILGQADSIAVYVRKIMDWTDFRYIHPAAP